MYTKRFCPMCGRALRGNLCLFEGYHASPDRCLACREGIHAIPQHPKPIDG